MNTHNCNLNIWAHLPEETWTQVAELYQSMPGWLGYIEGIPCWYGQETDEMFITASVEPSGLSFYARMDQSEWEAWIGRFKAEATRELGFAVGEPEDEDFN
ncbi:hypothetical protein [Paenibacillus piscarius]|uniref:hypothetical protein n=1 Tax=Paenibacillus piscarius TaxID=1089681 RepID=UPI001EE80CA7|nr:hypothetical protein [Paenibacillus piscarius]